MTAADAASGAPRPAVAAPAGSSAAAAAGTAAGGASGTSKPAGPESILVCAACHRRNRIRPNERGTPHCGSCGKPLPWLVTATDTTFDIEARSSVAVLVDLWAPWCGPCRFIGPILEELAHDFAGRLKVVKVNVDENPALARRFEALSIPTLVVLRGGRVVDRIQGALPKPDLTVRLTPYLLRS